MNFNNKVLKLHSLHTNKILNNKMQCQTSFPKLTSLFNFFGDPFDYLHLNKYPFVKPTQARIYKSFFASHVHALRA